MNILHDQLSLSTPMEEQVPPYDTAHSSADEQEWEWNDCGVPVGAREETKKEYSPPPPPLPPNPFVYVGTIPADIKPKNVILFGETGVGKSSIINLMASADVAPTSSNLDPCTFDSVEHTFVLPRVPSEPESLAVRVYDTVGLNEPDMGLDGFFGAIEKAHRLITSLHDKGGVDLLLFCIRGNRITQTVQRNYRLFVEFLCARRVPLAFVVTQLENEDVMETWWDGNATTLEKTYGMSAVAHACVTALPQRVLLSAEKRQVSLQALHMMFRDALGNVHEPYVMDVGSWLASLIEMIREFVLKYVPGLRKKALTTRLEQRCGLSREQAQKLAEMLAR